LVLHWIEGKRAVENLEKARDIATSIGAKGELAKVEKALARLR